MSYQLFTLLCLQISSINTAPLLLMPVSWMAQPPQQVVLQKQLMELQALQQLNAQSPFQMPNQPQPLLLLLPNDQTNSNVITNELMKQHNDHKVPGGSTPVTNFKQDNSNQPQPLLVLLPNDQVHPNVITNEHMEQHNDHKTPSHTNLEHKDDDLNSIVIDAAPEAAKHQNLAAATQPQRAILLVPNGRLSIGDVISAIPFLPVEINVPDTISWVYNGISSGIGSIISIIGRPFQGATQEAQTPEAGLQSLMKQIQMRRQNVVKPLLMMPIDGPVLPIQV